MTLTLTGPRLWILIKAFIFWAIKYVKENHKGRRGQTNYQLPLVDEPLLSSGRPQSNGIQLQPRFYETPTQDPSENLITTQKSHSEIGAALKLIGNVWQTLKLRHIELPTESATRQQPELIWISKIWKNFLQQPAEIALSLLLSAIFIGFFVAQSSGSVLSAKIISDGAALSTSPRCRYSSVTADDARFGGYNDYSERCYRSPLGADGCTLFYNQSISYTEQASDKCPFSNSSGNRCTEGIHAPITFDTGFVDAKCLGINAAKRHKFRRQTTCTPAWLHEDPETFPKCLFSSATNCSFMKFDH